MGAYVNRERIAGCGGDLAGWLAVPHLGGVDQTRLFFAALDAARLPRPLAEHRFHPTRQWRWDYAWPDHRVALEQQGGVWSRGRHGRGSGIVKDMAKFSAGACLGWRLLLVEPRDLPTRDTMALIREALAWTS